MVALDEDDRIVSLVEKPELPQSTLAATATYVFARAARCARRRLPGGGQAARPDRALPGLAHRQAPVYGYRFAGEWLDIGDHEQLLEADNRLRARMGLEPRAAYVL